MVENTQNAKNMYKESKLTKILNNIGHKFIFRFLNLIFGMKSLFYNKILVKEAYIGCECECMFLFRKTKYSNLHKICPHKINIYIKKMKISLQGSAFFFEFQKIQKLE